MAEERLLEGAAYVRKIHGFKIFVDELTQLIII